MRSKPVSLPQAATRVFGTRSQSIESPSLLRTPHSAPLKWIENPASLSVLGQRRVALTCSRDFCSANMAVWQNREMSSAQRTRMPSSHWPGRCETPGHCWTCGGFSEAETCCWVEVPRSLPLKLRVRSGGTKASPTWLVRFIHIEPGVPQTR